MTSPEAFAPTRSVKMPYRFKALGPSSEMRGSGAPLILPGKRRAESGAGASLINSAVGGTKERKSVGSLSFRQSVPEMPPIFPGGQ